MFRKTDRMNYANRNKAASPSQEGVKKDEKANLQTLFIRETHSSYSKPHLQSRQLENILSIYAVTEYSRCCSIGGREKLALISSML